MTHLFILIGCHSDEGCLLERVRVEGRPAHAEDVVSLNDVDTWLVLVHRVEDDLKIQESKLNEIVLIK